MQTSLLDLVGVPCVDVRADGSKDVGWCCEDESNGRTVTPVSSKTTNNGRVEVGESVGSRDGDVHKSQDVELGIANRKLESFPGTGLGLRGGRSISKDTSSSNLSHILGHSPHSTSGGR